MVNFKNMCVKKNMQIHTLKFFKWMNIEYTQDDQNRYLSMKNIFQK